MSRLLLPRNIQNGIARLKTARRHAGASCAYATTRLDRIFSPSTARNGNARLVNRAEFQVIRGAGSDAVQLYPSLWLLEIIETRPRKLVAGEQSQEKKFQQTGKAT